MEKNYSNLLRELYDLEIPFNGITINNQDIDLMLIAGSNNLEELIEALSIITNINTPLNITTLTEEEFFKKREEVFNMYLDNLISKNDYIRNKNIELIKKIEYLKKSGILNSKEISILNNIITTSKTKEEILEKITKSFSKDKIHMMSKTLRDFTPIEKTGIKSSTLETSRYLLEEIKNNYNSITIDEETKYGKVVLSDGTFDFRHLKKALDFAKLHDKQVRLNTLLFYMDCPEELYKLEKTPSNKILVKQKLQEYVDTITKFIVENGYSKTVRSIDVFNELLNRFALPNEIPYLYRGNIPQITNNELSIDDNIKSGWLKHLDIDDLCEIISIARKNMPTTDFMYNDDNLIDSKKISATIELIEQIKKNEKRLGVKLIDSIGTQMHIDNSITKEEIKEMIINLSQFGLPIEITEFDLVMTKNIENLTDEQIETIRQDKISEIYECINELKDKYNIRGFTIWSKTDKQNFRVSLSNEERLKKGQEPIETLHGGYYTKQMKPKKRVFQSFNYHTHTNRCGHAGISSDREFVEAAKMAGITQLGFSDHVPVTDLEYQDIKERMHISEVDEYISSIKKLQQENPNMTILVGFEAEYDPQKVQFLCELRDKVDYMILGQHFIHNQIPQKNNPNYPIEYAEILCEAMESGIFDIVAHPDIFMQYRDELDTTEKQEEFMKNAKIASRKICEKAKELGIPLEFNFAGINKEKIMKDGEYSYPYSEFWEIAAETRAPVLYGVDAHTPKQFKTMERDKEKADTIIESTKLNLIDKNYNPIEARKRNQKLNTLYEQTRTTALTYETHLINQILSRLLESIPEEGFNGEILYYKSESGFSQILENLIKKTFLINQKTSSNIEIISSHPGLSLEEKAFHLSRLKSFIEHTNDTLQKQQSALERAIETISTSIEIGCKSKQDFKTIINQITEGKTTKNNEKRFEIENDIKTIKKQIKEENKGKILIKKIDNSDDNKGFINIIALTLIIFIICIVAFSIGYMFYKINLN